MLLFYVKNYIDMHGKAVCRAKTRDRFREDTVLKNCPLYCPKCKQESLIDAKDLQVRVIKRIEAKMQDFKQ